MNSLCCINPYGCLTPCLTPLCLMVTLHTKSPIYVFFKKITISFCGFPRHVEDETSGWMVGFPKKKRGYSGYMSAIPICPRFHQISPSRHPTPEGLSQGCKHSQGLKRSLLGWGGLANVGLQHVGTGGLAQKFLTLLHWAIPRQDERGQMTVGWQGGDVNVPCDLLSLLMLRHAGVRVGWGC